MASAICTWNGANPSVICIWNGANRSAICTCNSANPGAICTWTVGVKVQIDPREKSHHHQPPTPKKTANLTVLSPSSWSPPNTSIREIYAQRKKKQITPNIHTSPSLNIGPRRFFLWEARLMSRPCLCPEHSQTVICKPCSENSWTKG